MEQIDITVDFESYYDARYTLAGSKGLPMSEYVKDQRFKLHGVAVKINDNESMWLHCAEMVAFFDYIRYLNVNLIAHNTQFDGFILSHHFGYVPQFYSDTLAMCRAVFRHEPADLDHMGKLFGMKGKHRKSALANTKGKVHLTDEEWDELGMYAKDDVDMCYAIYKRLRPIFPESELLLIHITTRMFCVPSFYIDLPLVREEIDYEISKKERLINDAGVDSSFLSSNQKFANLLETHGVLPPVKISPRTGKETFAFAKNDLAFQELAKHPSVGKLIKARLAIKSTGAETRAIRMFKAGTAALHEPYGFCKFPIALNYCGAATTRWSGGNKMNPQNLKRGSRLRKALLAPHGYVVVVVDSSQIEARTNAWFCGQWDMVQAFADGRDLYCEFAEHIYPPPITKANFKERFVGKVCILGLGYGMGAPKFQYTLESGAMGAVVVIDLLEADKIVRTYRALNPYIVSTWRMLQDILVKMMHPDFEYTYKCVTFRHEEVLLPNGLSLQYPGLRFVGDQIVYDSRNGQSKIYGAMFLENIIQALARVIVAEQMLEIDKHYKVVTTTHDEVVALAPQKEADEALHKMLHIMKTPPVWAPDLPVDAEGGWAKNYSK